MLSLNMNRFFYLKLKTGGGVVENMQEGRKGGLCTVHEYKIQRITGHG